MKKIVMLLISFLLISEIGKGLELDNTQNHTDYKTLVDGFKGFYRVYELETNELIPFENQTIYINKGDTMIWSNYDIVYPFIIISKEKLWSDDKGKLKLTGSRISYTFNKSGVYTFDIKDWEKFSSQVIIVNGTNDENATIDMNSVINNSSAKSVINNSSIENKMKNNSSIENKMKNNTIRNQATSINDSKTNMTIENNKNLKMSTNFFEPLNIMKNIKKILMITLGIIVIIFLFKGNGEEL